MGRLDVLWETKKNFYVYVMSRGAEKIRKHQGKTWRTLKDKTKCFTGKKQASGKTKVGPAFFWFKALRIEWKDV